MRNLFLKLWCFVVERLVGILAGLLVALLVIFVLVMFCETCKECVGELLGLHTKNPILKFLGIGMGGVLLALQALMSYKRAKALEDTANAQAEAAKAQAKATEEQAKANQNTEQGQRQERLKNAIEHLGHPSDSVRLGGAYELFHLAEDTADDTKDLRQTILDILCAHIRRTTGEEEYRGKYQSKPSEEIQSLLTLLFVQEHEVFKGLRINLQGSWLNGADLEQARLTKAVLTRAHLQRARLSSAYLQEANFVLAHLQKALLSEAYLHDAHLQHAYLQGANLVQARLQAANFGHAHLQDTYLFTAHMQGANLVQARLHGARLFEAHLHGATLYAAHLHGADLGRASLQGAELGQAHLHGIRSQHDDWSYAEPFAQRVRRRVAQQSDLLGITFTGGLSHERVEALVQELSPEKANALREKLRPHIDTPKGHDLPGNSRAITGTYTSEEAEQWIAEYNEAMSEVPAESNN